MLLTGNNLLKDQEAIDLRKLLVRHLWQTLTLRGTVAGFCKKRNVVLL